MEKRKTNFSEEERAVLLELVSRHRSVVENKKTDAVSVSRKRESWKKIEDEFNCRHSVTPRTWGQLKKCWENLKDKWRRCNAQDMRERFSTGGGTPSPSQATDELQQVGAIASHMAVRLSNLFDSDRSGHHAVPGESQSCQTQCTPAVVTLLSQTQNGSLGSQDAADEPDYWSWDDAGRPQAEPETNAAPLPTTTESRELVHGTASPDAVVTEPGAAATSSGPVPAGTRRPATSSSQRQTAVALELAARLSAIKDDREEKKKEHLLKTKYMRLEHKYKSLHRRAEHEQTMQLLRLKEANQKTKAEILKLQLEALKKK
nr:myb/SANT-like DNA-binding domain-containing protein 3 [Dermacentor andersoni]